jgi:putative membrane protein
MRIHLVLLAVHLLANLVWIGAILAVAVILRASTVACVPRGQLGLLVYRRLATPAFTVSFLAGVGLLVLHPRLYFLTMGFMWAKLALAVLVIGIHHVLGARARKAAAGDERLPGQGLVIALIVGALGAALLATLRPF